MTKPKTLAEVLAERVMQALDRTTPKARRTEAALEAARRTLAEYGVDDRLWCTCGQKGTCIGCQIHRTVEERLGPAGTVHLRQHLGPSAADRFCAGVNVDHLSDGALQ